MDANTISKLVKGINQNSQIAEIRINTDPALLTAVRSPRLDHSDRLYQSSSTASYGHSSFHR
jgi:hypothetical protein